MLNKINFYSLILVVQIAITFQVLAQSDSVIVNDSSTVQENNSATLSGITIPEGTKLMVNINDAVTTAHNPAGSSFKSILEVDFVFDGKVISPKGSPVYGKVIECRGGRVLGGSKLTIQFTDIMVNNELTPIVTEPIGVEGGKGNTAKTVGAGALIGGAFGSSGKGALVGGGLALLSAGRNHIQIPAGTLAEVPLAKPLLIK